jgi:hypothetical protein
VGAIDDDRCSASLTAVAIPSVAIGVHGLPPPKVLTYNSHHNLHAPGLFPSEWDDEVLGKSVCDNKSYWLEQHK